MVYNWWLTYPSEKYEFVNWDDDIPKSFMGKYNMFQTSNQAIDDDVTGIFWRHVLKNLFFLPSWVSAVSICQPLAD